MYSSIYRVQSSTKRLPIRALFGFMLKLVESYLSPSPQSLCVVVCPWYPPWVASQQQQQHPLLPSASPQLDNNPHILQPHHNKTMMTTMTPMFPSPTTTRQWQHHCPPHSLAPVSSKTTFPMSPQLQHHLMTHPSPSSPWCDHTPPPSSIHFIFISVT